MYNEHWFLSRQKKLASGDLRGELKTQTQWRNLLDGQRKRGHKFVRHCRELNETFLVRSFSEHAGCV